MARKDILKGGKADNLTIKDIANMHSVSEDDILQQLLKGIEIELEHTDDRDLAYEIALDHLFEIPDYYDRLEKMEKDATMENISTVSGTSFIVESYDGTFTQEVDIHQIQRLLEAEIISNQDFMEDILSYIELFEEAADVQDRRDTVESILTTEGIPFTNVSNNYANNVVVKLYNDEETIPQYAIAAHFDKVKGSKGINDNAVSVVVLIKIAKEYKDANLPIDIVFVDKEETGMLGSSLYGDNNRYLKHALVIDVIGYGDVPVVCDDSGTCSFPTAFNITDSLPSDNYSFNRKGIDSSLIVSVPRSDLVINSDGTVKLKKSPEFYQSFHGREYDDIKYINWSTVKKVYNDIVHYIETRNYTPLTPEELEVKLTPPKPKYDYRFDNFYNKDKSRSKLGKANDSDYDVYLDNEEDYYDLEDDPEWGKLSDDVWSDEYAEYEEYAKYLEDAGQPVYSLVINDEFNFFAYYLDFIDDYENQNLDNSSEEHDDKVEFVLDTAEDLLSYIGLPIDVDFFSEDLEMVFTEDGHDAFYTHLTKLMRGIDDLGFTAKIILTDLEESDIVKFADSNVIVYKPFYTYISYKESIELEDDEDDLSLEELEKKFFALLDELSTNEEDEEEYGEEYREEYEEDDDTPKKDYKYKSLASIGRTIEQEIKNVEGVSKFFKPDFSDINGPAYIFTDGSILDIEAFFHSIGINLATHEYFLDYVLYYFDINEIISINKFTLEEYMSIENRGYEKLYGYAGADFFMEFLEGEIGIIRVNTGSTWTDDRMYIGLYPESEITNAQYRSLEKFIDLLFSEDAARNSIMIYLGRNVVYVHNDEDPKEVIKSLRRYFRTGVYASTQVPEDTEAIVESKEMRLLFKQAVGDDYYRRFYSNRVHSRIEPKDIGHWTKYPEELKDEIDRILSTPTRKQKELMVKEGATRIYEDDNYYVYSIESLEACQTYGRNTMWCITMQNHWEEYTEDYHFLFYIPKRKGLESYAVQLDDEFNEVVDIFDSADNNVLGIYKVPVSPDLPNIPEADGMTYSDYYIYTTEKIEEQLRQYTLDGKVNIDIISKQLLEVYGKLFLTGYVSWLNGFLDYLENDLSVTLDYGELTESSQLESREMKQRFKAAVGDQYYELFYTPRVYNRIRPNDIGYWTKRPESLKIEIDRLLEQPTQAEIRANDIKGAKLLYEDNNYRVYEISTYSACAVYGRGTKWCITQQSYWYGYTDDGSEFLFYVPKNQSTHDKYAIRIYDESYPSEQGEYAVSIVEVWDSSDREVAGIVDAPVNDALPTIANARGMSYLEYYEPWIHPNTRGMLLEELDAYSMEDVIEMYRKPWLTKEQEFLDYADHILGNYTDDDDGYSYDDRDDDEDDEDYEEDIQSQYDRATADGLLSLLRRILGESEDEERDLSSITEDDITELQQVLLENEDGEDDLEYNYSGQEPVEFPMPHPSEVNGDHSNTLIVSPEGYPTYIFINLAKATEHITSYISEKHPDWGYLTWDMAAGPEDYNDIIEHLKEMFTVRHISDFQIDRALMDAEAAIKDVIKNSQIDQDGEQEAIHLHDKLSKVYPLKWITKDESQLIEVKAYPGLFIPVTNIYFDTKFDRNYYLLKKFGADRQIKAIMYYYFGSRLKIRRVVDNSSQNQ